MAESVRVQAVYILGELESALGRFAAEAEEIRLAVEREIQRTLQWLEDRRLYWQRQTERCMDDVEEARRALARCEASEEEDDCAEEEQALHAARRRLETARQELASVQRWTARVREAVVKYETEARRLQHLSTVRTEQARAILKQRLGELERYLLVRPAAGQVFTDAVSGPSASVEPAGGQRGVVTTTVPREGVHFAMFESDVPPEIEGALFDAIGKVGLFEFLERYPLKHLRFLSSFEVFPGKEMRDSVGFYHPELRYLAVNLGRTPGTYGELLVPGVTYSISKTGKDAADAASKTLVHELGHHVYAVIAETNPEIRTMAHATFAKALGSSGFFTLYASAKPSEYFAEAFAAYAYFPAELERHDPETFELVRHARKVGGIDR